MRALGDDIWIGNARDARDIRSLHEHGIRAVVDLALEEKPIAELPREFIYNRVPLLDGEGNTPERMSYAIQLTLRLLSFSPPVLIACSAGMSRSPSIAAATIAIVRDTSLELVLEALAGDQPLDVAPALFRDVDMVCEQIRTERSMLYPPQSPFYRFLGTKYDPKREAEALAILDQHPQIATLSWPGPDDKGNPFVRRATALHYAANDGKLSLVARLIELGADVNADKACWFRSVLSWAANNARNACLAQLLEAGARPDSLDALHAAAWGGSSRGQGAEDEYADALRLLIDAGADMNDRRSHGDKTPLAVALESGNSGAIDYLRRIGADA